MSSLEQSFSEVALDEAQEIRGLMSEIKKALLLIESRDLHPRIVVELMARLIVERDWKSFQRVAMADPDLVNRATRLVCANSSKPTLFKSPSLPEGVYDTFVYGEMPELKNDCAFELCVEEFLKQSGDWNHPECAEILQLLLKDVEKLANYPWLRDAFKASPTDGWEDLFGVPEATGSWEDYKLVLDVDPCPKLVTRALAKDWGELLEWLLERGYDTVEGADLGLMPSCSLATLEKLARFKDVPEEMLRQRRLNPIPITKGMLAAFGDKLDKNVGHSLEVGLRNPTPGVIALMNMDGILEKHRLWDYAGGNKVALLLSSRAREILDEKHLAEILDDCSSDPSNYKHIEEFCSLPGARETWMQMPNWGAKFNRLRAAEAKKMGFSPEEIPDHADILASAEDLMEWIEFGLRFPVIDQEAQRVLANNEAAATYLLFHCDVAAKFMIERGSMHLEGLGEDSPLWRSRIAARCESLGLELPASWRQD